MMAKTFREDTVEMDVRGMGARKTNKVETNDTEIEGPPVFVFVSYVSAKPHLSEQRLDTRTGPGDTSSDKYTERRIHV